MHHSDRLDENLIGTGKLQDKDILGRVDDDVVSLFNAVIARLDNRIAREERMEQALERIEHMLTLHEKELEEHNNRLDVIEKELLKRRGK